MPSQTSRSMLTATLIVAAVSVTGCGKANIATPEPGEGAVGFVSDRGDAVQASARPNQTAPYLPHGAVRSKTTDSPDSPAPDTASGR